MNKNMQSLSKTVSEFVSRIVAFIAPAGVEQAQPIAIMSPRMKMMMIKRQQILRAASRERY